MTSSKFSRVTVSETPKNTPAVAQPARVAHRAVEHAAAAPGVGLALPALDAQDRYQLVLRAQFAEDGVVEQQAVGEEREDDIGKPARDVEYLGPDQRLAAREHHDGDSQFLRLREDAPPLLDAQLRFARIPGAGARSSRRSSGCIAR